MIGHRGRRRRAVLVDRVLVLVLAAGCERKGKERRCERERQEPSHRVCGTFGRVADSGSSVRRSVCHLVEAREVHVVVDDAVVVVLVEAARVAVRALDDHLVQGLRDLRAVGRGRFSQRGREHVDEVIRVHRRLGRLHDLEPGFRLHADEHGAERTLQPVLDELERLDADLGCEPAAREGQPVDPGRMVGEPLADERIAAGRRCVEGHLPAGGACGGDRRRDRRGAPPDDQRWRARWRARRICGERSSAFAGRVSSIATDDRSLRTPPQRRRAGRAVVRVVVQQAEPEALRDQVTRRAEMRRRGRSGRCGRRSAADRVDDLPVRLRRRRRSACATARRRATTRRSRCPRRPRRRRARRWRGACWRRPAPVRARCPSSARAGCRSLADRHTGVVLLRGRESDAALDRLPEVRRSRERRVDDDQERRSAWRALGGRRRRRGAASTRRDRA